MILDWESENMAWRFYLQIEWGSFYFALVLAGIDISFGINNLRDIIYHGSASTKQTA